MKHLIDILTIKKAVRTLLFFAVVVFWCSVSFEAKAQMTMYESYQHQQNLNFGTCRDYEYKQNNPEKCSKNASCNIDDMQKKYQSSCYSCFIVKTLIEKFMNAAGRTYGVAHDAGVYILILGTVFWIMIFALKNVSSMANVEPMDMLNELLKQIFKVVVAMAFLKVGLSAIVGLGINPLLATGADYGIGIIQGAAEKLPIPLDLDDNSDMKNLYEPKGTEVISASAVNRILKLNQAIDKVVSINLVVGHALTCHSYNAGLITLVDKWSITIKILDFWIWFVGAVIWIFGFLMTVAVSYYLLDISFKIGLSIMVMPLAIALWPFPPTSDKLKKCFSIIISSAGTFAFLAITSVFALMLMSEALRDTTELLRRIKIGDARYISETFAITGSFFLIIVFAFLYGFLLIGKTISEYSSQFFSDSVIGSTSPMHHRMTQFTMAVEKVRKKMTGYVGDVARFQGKKAASGVGQAAGKGVQSVGKGIDKGGKAIANAGKALGPVGAVAGGIVGGVVSGVGKVTNAVGKGVEKGAKAANPKMRSK